MIFSIRDSGVVSVEPGLDLSTEVVKRFDAAAKTPGQRRTKVLKVLKF